MIPLLRFSLKLSGLLALLIFASSVIGHLEDADIVTGNMLIEGDVYALYVEDLTHRHRIPLEGKYCFAALPPWVFPEVDATPMTPPGHDYGRFYAEQVMNVMDVLAQCRPS